MHHIFISGWTPKLVQFPPCCEQNENRRVGSLLYDVESLGYVSRSGIVGLFGRSTISLWMRLHTDFHSGCTSLCSHQ